MTCIQQTVCALLIPAAGDYVIKYRSIDTWLKLVIVDCHQKLADKQRESSHVIDVDQ
jgi:hypothetical protein